MRYEIMATMKVAGKINLRGGKYGTSSGHGVVASC